MDITLHGYTYQNCNVVWSEYTNGRTALQLFLPTGEPVIKASVNVPEEYLPDEHIFIKNYSENDGIMEELIKHNIIIDTGLTIIVGYALANVCKLVNKTSKEQ